MKAIHVIRSERVVTPEGVAAATVHISNGKITAVRGHDDLPPGVNVYDARESVVMPGLVDTHVHINEPGRTDWEGFETATRAAAAGGVTTLIDMPLNSIPATTTVAALEIKRAAANAKMLGQCWLLGRSRTRKFRRASSPGPRGCIRIQMLPGAIGRGGI